MPRKPSCILLLKCEESPITCNNFHLSLDTQEQTYQTYSRHHNQAVTRAICLSNTLHLRNTIKLLKQSKPCRLSAISQSLQAFWPKLVPLPYLQPMQAIQKLRHDL